MKTILLMLLFIFFVIIALPVFLSQSCTMLPASEDKCDDEAVYETIVYMHRDGMIKNMDLEEYIMGVVAAEMPADFHIEALKAQAVAARTYTVKRMTSLGGSPNTDHPEVDVCTDSTHCQAWISDEDFRKNIKDRFGLFGYRGYLKNMNRAVKDTQGIILVYKGEVIDPLFHSTSGGFTEDSEQVFAAEVPYLRSVASPYEDHSPRLYDRTEIKITDFVKILKQKFNGLKIDSKDVPSAVRVLEVSRGGKVISIKIGNKVLSGREIRAAFGLNSTDFKITREGDTVVIATVGYGHGVGMSQYGADGMAKKGDTYDRILKHYYTGAELKHMEEVFGTVRR